MRDQSSKKFSQTKLRPKSAKKRSNHRENLHFHPHAINQADLFWTLVKQTVLFFFVAIQLFRDFICYMNACCEKKRNLHDFCSIFEKKIKEFLNIDRSSTAVITDL